MCKGFVAADRGWKVAAGGGVGIWANRWMDVWAYGCMSGKKFSHFSRYCTEYARFRFQIGLAERFR